MATSLCSACSASPVAALAGHGQSYRSRTSFLGASLANSVHRSLPRGGQLRRHQGRQPVVCGLFGLGVPELVVIAGVAAVLFGPKQLPQVGKSLGKTVKSFQEAAKEFESEIKQGMESASESVSPPSIPPSTTTAPSKKPEEK